jgi:hypothetical protein
MVKALAVWDTLWRLGYDGQCMCLFAVLAQVLLAPQPTLFETQLQPYATDLNCYV